MTTRSRTSLRFGGTPTASPALVAGLVAAVLAPSHGWIAGLVVVALLVVPPAAPAFGTRMRTTISRLAMAVVGLSLAWPPVSGWARAGAIAAAAGIGWVLAAQLVKRRLLPHGESTLIVGETDMVLSAVRTFLSYPSFNVRPVATATPDGLEPSRLPGGSMEDIRALVEAHNVTHVISVSPEHAPKLERLIGRDRPVGVRVSAMQGLGEILTGDVDVVSVRGLPFISLAPRRPPAGPAWMVKRSIDYLVGGGLLVIFSPLFAMAAIAIKLGDGGPVFFRQERVGRNGQLFDVWKFRSMVPNAERLLADLAHLNEADGAYFKIEKDPRVTRVGAVLRRLSIDEIPQLLNVVRGEMSLVGPRPFLAAEMQSDPEAFEWRVHFLPGITGLWQVAGRSWLPRLEGLRMDLAYIEHWSPTLDVRIMLRTIVVAMQNDRRPSYEHLHPVPDSRSRVARVMKLRRAPARVKPSPADGARTPS